MSVYSKRSLRRKLVIVGDGFCGKTSLLVRYRKGEFNSEYCPTVFENSSVEIEVANKKVELTLFDTAGQEEYESLRPLSYPGTDIVLLCYAIDNPDGLDNIELLWTPEVSVSYSGLSVNSHIKTCNFSNFELRMHPNETPLLSERCGKTLFQVDYFAPGVSKMIVGTKKDLRHDPATIDKLNSQKPPEHPVELSDAEIVKDKIKAKACMECSAKTNEGVAEVFKTAASLALKKNATPRKHYSFRKSVSLRKSLGSSSCQII